MSNGLVSAAYIAASVLFILALGGLRNQESAKRAIWYGIVGMGIAMAATILSPGVGNMWLIILTVAVGAVAGVYVAQRVQMTEMPQLVAALHSFVGLAAVFIGLNADIMLGAVSEIKAAGTALADADLTAFGEKLWKKDLTEIAILKVEVFLGIFIGAITFTGSVVAFGKLAGKIDGKPKKLSLPPGENPIPFISCHWLNALSLIFCLLMALLYFNGAGIWTMV
ncbi:MAG: NAD(P)(+) transhydrogenase (Re/Si-specific) subunit beta, partial [Boseongicola sp.]